MLDSSIRNYIGFFGTLTLKFCGNVPQNQEKVSLMELFLDKTERRCYKTREKIR